MPKSLGKYVRNMVSVRVETIFCADIPGSCSLSEGGYVQEVLEV